MKHRCTLLCAIAAMHLTSYAQTISLSTNSIDFDTIFVNARDSLSFHIRNYRSDTLTVTDIKTHRNVYTVSNTSFTVPPNDSAQVWVYFTTNQNVTWTDVLLVENIGARETLPMTLRGTARFTDTYYSSTQGLWEDDLKSALHNLITPHVNLGYNVARDRMFETIDDPAGIDTIECVYTGRRIFAQTRTQAQNADFNTEHTWPQGFYSQADPMRSDLHHLFPTDSAANSARSNFPFGPVVSNIMWQTGGSRVGFNPNGLIAFEPRDVHKGDAARAMFYFILRYQTNYGNFLDIIQEFYLRQWYRLDTVSTKEILRNNAIASFQGKRNPLIDHPEFIDRITYFRPHSPPQVNPDISVSPMALDFGTVAVGDSSEWNLTIVNSGLAPLTIFSVSFQTPTTIFQIVDTAASVPIDSFVQVRVRFKPDQPNQTYSNTLVIQSDDPDQGTLEVPLNGSSSGPSSVSEEPAPISFTLYQNYPNPFNPTTTIHFAIPVKGFATLKAYDMLGREVATIVHDELIAGEYKSEFRAEGLSSGIYVYKLLVNGHTFMKKMILLK